MKIVKYAIKIQNAFNVIKSIIQIKVYVNYAHKTVRNVTTANNAPNVVKVTYILYKIILGYYVD